MANILSSSIGKKVIMSLSGLFLITFLLLHLAINLTAIFSEQAYNAACHFMDTNIFIKIMVPVLAAGFIIHIVYAFVLTIHNMKARPIKYAIANNAKASSWASRNMFALGVIVLGFLAFHLTHFWAKMQLLHFTGGIPAENPWLLVKTTLENPINTAIYLIWFWALWYHLCHGFWSAFQSIGTNNSIWIPRLQNASRLLAGLIVLGFSVVVLWFVFGLSA
ncbi:MAG: succinate dehydrogenase cytochrome b subunit [Bacteroidales bacterium]